jgi:hypothetical protein
MQIDLTMRVTYFGPMKDMVEYHQEEVATSDKIPWDLTSPSPFTITRADIEAFGPLMMEEMKKNMLTPDQVKDMIKLSETLNKLSPGSGDRWILENSANADLNASVVDFALKMATEHHTQYADDKGHAPSGARSHLWDYADCSSFVWGAFAGHDPPYNDQMGKYWDTPFDLGTGRATGHASGTIYTSQYQLKSLKEASCPNQKIFDNESTKASERHAAIDSHLPELVKGDLILRKAGIGGHDKGHIAFIFSNNPDTKMLEVVHAGSIDHVGKFPLAYASVAEGYTAGFRVLLGTPNSVDASQAPVGA